MNVAKILYSVWLALLPYQIGPGLMGPGPGLGQGRGSFSSTNTYSTTCSTGTTCTVTATNGIAAGNVVVIAGVFVNSTPITSTSIDGSGSVDARIRGGAANNRRNLFAWVVKSASTVSAGGTFTVNFSGTNGGGYLWTVDLTPAPGSPDPTIDAINDYANNSGGPSLSGCSWSSGTVTCTISSAASVITGNSYTVSGVTPSGYNTNSVVATISGTTLTYPLASDPGAYTSGGALGNVVVTSIPGVPLTLSGQNDTVVQWVSCMAGASAGTVSSVSSPWDTVSSRTSYAGFALVSGVQSITPPTWACSAGATIVGTAAIAIGFNATPCTMDSFVDWSGGSNGSVPTVPDLTKSTRGMTGNSDPLIINANPYFWKLTSVSGYLAYATESSPPPGASSVRVCKPGTTFTPSSALSMVYSSPNASATHYVTQHTAWGQQSTTASQGPVWVNSTWIKTSFTAADTVSEDASSLLAFSGTGPSRFANAYISATGSVLRFYLEMTEPNLSACSWSGGVATCTLSATGAGYPYSGETYTITGVTPSGYNTTATVTISGSTLTYPLASDPGGYTSGGKLTATVSISTNTWYRIDSMLAADFKICAYVRDTSGNQVGYTMCQTAGAAGTIGTPYFWNFGDNGVAGQTSGRNTRVGYVRNCFGTTSTCSFPLPF